MSAGRSYTTPEALVPQYLQMADNMGLQRMMVVQARATSTWLA